MWHRGSALSNNSLVDHENITGGNDLFCLTNYDTGSILVGTWYSPDRSEVSQSGNGYHYIRGKSFVALTHSGSSSPPSGLYFCEIPDSRGQTVTLFAGLYRSGLGKLALYLLLKG